MDLNELGLEGSGTQPDAGFECEIGELEHVWWPGGDEEGDDLGELDINGWDERSTAESLDINGWDEQSTSESQAESQADSELNTVATVDIGAAALITPPAVGPAPDLRSATLFRGRALRP